MADSQYGDAETRGQPYSKDSARARALRLSEAQEWSNRFGGPDMREHSDAAYDRLVARQGYDPLEPDGQDGSDSNG